VKQKRHPARGRIDLSLHPDGSVREHGTGKVVYPPILPAGGNKVTIDAARLLREIAEMGQNDFLFAEGDDPSDADAIERVRLK
jgi:hypothetical protein